MMQLEIAVLLAGFAVDAAKGIEASEAARSVWEGNDPYQNELTASIDYRRGIIADVEKALPDRELCAAYQQTSGEEGDIAADKLLAEIERRGLDT